jgi:branched-chain amino acid aminotransferase
VTNEVIAKNNVQNGYVRPVAFRGSEMMAVSAQQTSIHVAIATWSWPTYFSNEAKERGLRLQISKWARPAPNTAPTASKAAGLYMICTLSKHAAEQAGFEDALMLDWRGLIAEATGANIFFVMNGELHTPTPDCFLDGITRRSVMMLAKERSLKVVERQIKLDELAKAQEVFICGTAAEVTPIGMIESQRFTVGPVTRQLMEDYAALVGK